MFHKSFSRQNRRGQMLKVRCHRRTFCMSEFPSTFRAVTPSKLLITILLLLLDRLLHRILLCKQLEWDPKKIKQEKKEQEMKARQAAAAGSTTAGSEQVTVSLLSSPLTFLLSAFYAISQCDCSMVLRCDSYHKTYLATYSAHNSLHDLP